MITGLRRSSIYVPGDIEKMIHKAALFPADLLILNLEDGVSFSRKDAARDNIVRMLRETDFGEKETVVRINSMSMEIGKRDLAAVVPCRPDGICLPKVEKASEIHAVDAALLELEIVHNFPKGTMRLHAMIESAAGVLGAPEIAAASPRMASLIFGSADYAKDLRCRPGEDRMELTFALQMIVHSARAAGIDAIDAPCFDLHNHELLRREAQHARRLGFDGKSVLHPEQIGPINEVFDFTPEDIAWAGKVLAELDEAEKQGRALTTMEGQLIDNPHRAVAERILRRRRS